MCNLNRFPDETHKNRVSGVPEKCASSVFSPSPDLEMQVHFGHRARTDIAECAECDADSFRSGAGCENDMNTELTLLLRDTDVARAKREQDRVTALPPRLWGIWVRLTPIKYVPLVVCARRIFKRSGGMEPGM